MSNQANEDTGQKEPGRIGQAGRKIAAVGAGAGRAGASVAKGFWFGFRFPFKGARFCYLDHPGLVKYWIWPVLITISLFTAATVSIYLWHEALLALVWAPPEGDGFWVTVSAFLRPVVKFLLFFVLIALALFVLSPVSSVLAGPFNGLLSEEVERLYKGLEGPPFSFKVFIRDLFLTIRLEVGKLCLYALVMGPALVISWLIPVVGQAVYMIFGTLFTMIFFAVDYTDWPLAKRGHGVFARAKLVRAHFMRMFGLGTAVWLCLIIPFVGLLFMPAAVTGGTLLMLDLEQDGGLTVLEKAQQDAPTEPAPQS